MGELVKFPDTEYILRCHNCKSNSFYVKLGSKDWTKVKEFECVICGKISVLPRSTNLLKSKEVSNDNNQE